MSFKREFTIVNKWEIMGECSIGEAMSYYAAIFRNRNKKINFEILDNMSLSFINL
jgi:hypothetical protein